MRWICPNLLFFFSHPSCSCLLFVLPLYLWCFSPASAVAEWMQSTCFLIRVIGFACSSKWNIWIMQGVAGLLFIQLDERIQQRFYPHPLDISFSKFTEVSRLTYFWQYFYLVKCFKKKVLHWYTFEHCLIYCVHVCVSMTAWQCFAGCTTTHLLYVFQLPVYSIEYGCGVAGWRATQCSAMHCSVMGARAQRRSLCSLVGFH